jgi:hypothetical protein
MIKEVCEGFNPELISKLENTKEYQGEIYFAIKEALEEFILENIPEIYPQSQKTLASMGFCQSMNFLRMASKKFPQPTFCLPVGIYVDF